MYAVKRDLDLDLDFPEHRLLKTINYQRNILEKLPRQMVAGIQDTFVYILFSRADLLGFIGSIELIDIEGSRREILETF